MSAVVWATCPQPRVDFTCIRQKQYPESRMKSYRSSPQGVIERSELVPQSSTGPADTTGRTSTQAIIPRWPTALVKKVPA